MSCDYGVWYSETSVTKEEAAKAEPVKPEAEEPKGPYSPGAKPPVRTPAKK